MKLPASLRNSFSAPLSDRLVAAGVLLCALVVTVGLYIHVRQAAVFSAGEHFQFLSREAEIGITQRMTGYEKILQGGIGLFSATPWVTRSMWHTYVESLKVQESYPGILGIGFAVRVPLSMRDEHIRQVRAEGFPDYTIQPAGDREEYAPVVYIEPFEGRNLRAFGYDMYSEPVRNEAMVRARDFGVPAPSAVVTLVQETTVDVQRGFLLYLPLYRQGAAHATMEERRAALLGYVYGAFRMNDLMTGILGREIPNIRVEVFDGLTQHDSTLMYSSEPDSGNHRPVFSKVETISILGHPWTLHFTSPQSFEEAINYRNAYVVLGSGIAISLLLFVLTLSLGNARMHASDLAAEVEERTRAVQALRNSEARTRKLLESNLIGVIFVDLAGHIREVNDAWLSITGYSREDIASSVVNWRELTVPQYQGVVDHAIEELQTTGSHYPFEKEIMRKDGLPVPVMFGITLLEPGSDEAVGFVVDLSEYRIAQERLRYSEARFRLLVEQAPLSIQIFSPDGQTIRVNRAWEELFGVKAHTAIGYNILHDAQLEERGIMDHIRKAFQGERVIIPPTPYVSEGGVYAGQERWSRAIMYPVRTPDGTIREVILVLEDITERRNAEQQVQRMNEELERRVIERTEQLASANKELEAFSYSVSHDLQAPLRAINGFAGALAEDYRDRVDETGKRYLRAIEENAFKMSQLINDLLAFSRVSRKGFSKAPVDMKALVEDTLAEVRTQHKGTEPEVTVKDLPPVAGDQALLRQVWMNLITNAFKFTGKTEKPCVVIGSERFDRSIMYYVEDNGAGFDMQYVEKLFGVFQRLHSEDEFSGTGIGLAIVKRIVEKHGGKVSAEGEPDAGAKFRFTLPIE